jgi:hypothetical protein
MNKNLGRKILCSLITASICGTVNFALAANSGGENNKSNTAYVGNNGTSSDNNVYFDDNSGSYNYVVGGHVKNNGVSANENNVTVAHGAKVNDVYGGLVQAVGKANYNSVLITDDSTIESVVIGGYVDFQEDSSTGREASYNTVVINKSTVHNSGTSYIVGGFTLSDSKKIVDGKTNHNKVIIMNDSTINCDIYGGRANSGKQANYNEVIITDSTVNKNVYGGRAHQDDVSYNKIVLDNATIRGHVYGGYVANVKNDNNVNSTITNNSITITGDSNLKEASLSGLGTDAEKQEPGKDQNFSYLGENNKLVLSGFSGGDKQVQSLKYFNSIEVKALANGEYTAGSTTTVVEAGSIEHCDVGQANQTAMIGVARKAEGVVSIVKDDVNFKIENIKAAEQTAITTETRAAAAAFVNQGAEVVTDSLDMLSREEEGINTIAIVSGNNSKYKTGSYIDINGWNNLIGIANTKEIGNDKLNYSAFFENGSGNYNTFNDFDGNALRGDGNVVYNGGGMAVRFDKENGFYTEAAVRAGSVKNEVSNALSNGSSTYGYETDNTYYGGHIGIGKTFKLENGKAWDIYGKYFYMHYEDDSIMIAGDRFDFDSVDSNKLRIGARFSEQQGEKLTSYYGLAWDYEFSGDVSGTAEGYDMHSPSLEGSTVIGEVGFRYTPGKESPWSFDAKLRGYVGQQEGISGNVQAVYSF